MPIYLITKPMTAYLTVDCKDENEAREWQKRIVATLEDENGESILSNKAGNFEASSHLADIKIELLEENFPQRK